MTLETTTPTDLGVTWHEVCSLKSLSRERGAAALVEGTQVALFRTFDDRVHAVQQLDPFSGANVMSRGIVGTRGSVPTVASPMYKQVFDLRTGACLDPVGKEPRSLQTFPVHIVDGVVAVALPTRPTGSTPTPEPPRPPDWPSGPSGRTGAG